MIGIKFSHYGQIYYFDCDDPDVIPGEHVLAETNQGLGLGMVVSMAEEAPPDIAPEDIVPVVRRATEQDRAAARENVQLAEEARRFCDARIRERGLDMKLVDVEVLFDRSKFVFYFTAPTRIDFRELVKDLVREYHTRIELRQIGVRHETQMLGAVGSCGMVCCCRRFLRKFVPVTIKMAKEQNLFLNPSKISGICGRLLCCLSYEQENYDIFHRNCPRLGKRYQTNKGAVKILRANLFRNSIALLTETNEKIEVSLDEWRDMEPRRPDTPPPGKMEFSAGGRSRSEQDIAYADDAGEQTPYGDAEGFSDCAERDASEDDAEESEEGLKAADGLAGDGEGRDDSGDARRRRRRRRK